MATLIVKTETVSASVPSLQPLPEVAVTTLFYLHSGQTVSSLQYKSKY